MVKKVNVAIKNEFKWHDKKVIDSIELIVGVLL